MDDSVSFILFGVVAVLILAVMATTNAVDSSETAMVTGTYVGDGSINKSITGLGFQPRFVVIYNNQSGSAAGFTMKTDVDGDYAFTPMTSAYNNLYAKRVVISLDTDGFTVGSGSGSVPNLLNIRGRGYVYMALK